MIADRHGRPIHLTAHDQSDYAQCVRTLQIINQLLGWDWVVTSYIRDDNAAHREGRAVDFAARSGPLYALRRKGVCPAYHEANVLQRLFLRTSLVSYIAEAAPRVHLILLEPDHVHVETSHYDRPRRLDVVQYASRTNALCPNLVDRVERTIIAMELKNHE